MSLSPLRDALFYMQTHLSAKKFPGAQAIHRIPAKPTMQRSNTAMEEWPAASHSTTVPELYPTSTYGPLFGSCLLRGKTARKDFGTRASNDAWTMCSATPTRNWQGWGPRGVLRCLQNIYEVYGRVACIDGVVNAVAESIEPARPTTYAKHLSFAREYWLEHVICSSPKFRRET